MPYEEGEKIMIVSEDAEEGARGYRLTTTGVKNGSIAIL